MSNSALVGRERERQQLLAAVFDPNVRLISVAGQSGAGKTALALEVGELARAKGAVVGIGKHAEDAGGRTPRPLGDAFRTLVDHALDQLHDPEAGLASLRTALGASAQALNALDPGILNDDVIETAPLTAEAAGERLALASVRLLRWLGGFGAPILIILDDWGRAGPSTAKLYERLAQEPDLGEVTLLGTERISEPSSLSGAVTVALEDLDRAALQAIATARLDGEPVVASAVLALMDGRARTPLALLQTLATLVDARGLVHEPGGWRLDRATAASTLGDDAAEALVRQICSHAPLLARVLNSAAVHGDGATDEDLREVGGLDRPRLDAMLRIAVAEGLLEIREDIVRFRHDSIRAAVLRGLTPDARARIASTFAEHLRASGQASGPRLETALRLRLEGGVRVEDPAAWVPLFITGAAEARTIGANAQARTFASAAMEMEEQAGEAAFATAREAALAALQDGDLRAGAEFAELMRARASGEDQQMLAAETAVIAARLAGDQAKAFVIGREALAGIGFAVPEKAGMPSALMALGGLRLKPDVRIAGAAGHGAPAYRLLNTVGYIAFERSPPTAVVLAARTAGFDPLRGTAYAAGLRTLLTCLTGDWAGAVRNGEAAFQRLETADQPLRAPAMQMALQFGVALTQSGAAYMRDCQRLQALALEDGDLGIAAYANRDCAIASARLSIPIAEHRRNLALCKENADRYADRATGPFVDALDQMAVNLTEGGHEPWRMYGEVYQGVPPELADDQEVARVAIALLTFETMLANAFGAWEHGAAIWRQMGDRFDKLKHHPVTAVWAFHSGLARARLGLPVKAWEARVVARAARFNPGYAHRDLTMKAEHELRRGRIDLGLATYEAAILAAEAAGFYFEHGIVAAAARTAAQSHRRHAVAERFDASATTAWTRMGADAMLTKPVGDAMPPMPVPSASAPGELDLRNAWVAAERANKAKTRLLAGAAHELRTPMQGIQGLLDLATEDPQSLDVSRMREAFAGLRAVVDDLTDYGTVEAERLSIVHAPFVPLRVVITEIELARQSAGERSIRLLIEGDVEQPRQGDAGRIAQVLRNLLSNALRYGDGEVLVSLALDGDSLRLEVADRGPGLSAADQSRLFQPFVRGDASGRAEGSGLGLSLSRRIAQQMGGTLTGENRADGGALFRLTIPCPLAGEAALSADSSPLTILLAEDVDLSRETMAKLLEKRGHRVIVAADGREAVERAREQAFDVLVMDVRMPHLDGPNALAELRHKGVVTPAVVLSAAVDEHLAERLVGLEPVRLVRKPLTADQLAKIVQGIGADRTEPEPVVDAEVVTALRVRQAALIEARRAQDLAHLGEIAHAAAGLAITFGLVRLDQILIAVEAAARADDSVALDAQLAQLAGAMATLPQASTP